MESSLARAAFFGAAPQIERVYAQGRRQTVEGLTECAPGVWGADAWNSSQLAATEVVFSTWGMPRLSAEQLTQLPNLRAKYCTLPAA